jgi:hypothetical protein
MEVHRLDISSLMESEVIEKASPSKLPNGTLDQDDET